MDDKRTKECTEALTAVQLSRMVMDLKLNDRKNDRGKEIKGLKITTTSEEEVLPDKENTRKVVSKTHRRIEFIETSVPRSLPAPNEDAPAPDQSGPRNSLVRMNCSIIAELRQWTQWIQLNPSFSLLKPPCPKFTIITDAAPQGWGATFSQLEKPKNIRLPNQAPENLQIQPFPSKIVPSTSFLTFGR
jgi:hypothetical protein